jgi:hypothetical protein
MSDAAQPTASEVRAAAEALKTALDRHLAAVERRSAGADDDDSDVHDAFEALAAAAETYDELLYDAYDEVTPFEIPAGEGLPEYDGPDEPTAISVFVRRDYTVREPRRLLREAVRAAGSDLSAGAGVNAAVSALFGEYEPDEVAARHEEFGLEEGDSTIWVTAADEPAEPGEWLAAPFEGVEPHTVVCRFDVSAVFDDELEALDPDRDA